MNTIFRTSITILALTLTACSDQNNDLTTIKLADYLHGKLNKIEKICEQTKSSEIQGSECFFGVQAVSEQYQQVLTRDNSILLESVLIDLNRVSLEIYDRNMKYLKETSLTKL
jgi:hypothetical protein